MMNSTLFYTDFRLTSMIPPHEEPIQLAISYRVAPIITSLSQGFVHFFLGPVMQILVNAHSCLACAKIDQLTKSRCPNITPPQLNTQNLLHTSQNLLIRRRTTPLKVRHDTLGGIALRRQILLRHLRLHLLPLLTDDCADFLSDRGGLDDVVASVDFREALAFDAG
jgi:hypothetical protein